MKCQTLALKETVLGREHPDTLASMNNLAQVLVRQGKYEEAEAMNRQTMALKETVLGREHPSTLTSMNNLAQVLNSQGKHEEAEAMHRQTLAGYERVLGHEHPHTLASMHNLALVFNRQGKYEEAEAMLRQTLARREKVLGHEHPSILTSMNNLAEVFNNQGKYEKAEAMHRRTLAWREKVLGHEHPSTLTSMNNLALVLNRQSKYEEAEAMHRQTLARREKVLGHEHPHTLASMNNLAQVLNSQGKYEEAEAMHRQTLALREKVLGHEHPDTLSSMANLALTLRNQNRLKEAEALDEANTASTELQSAFWSDQTRSTNPSSLSRAVMDMEQITNNYSPTIFYRYKPSADNFEPDERDGEIQSVRSVPDDIGSLAESVQEMRDYRQAAVSYIVKTFVDDLELLSLYQEAIHCMDGARFVNNNRRLLKRFFLDLRDEGRAASQELAVQFLRSRSTRTHISSEIHRLLMPSGQTLGEKVNLMLKQEQGNISMLERFMNEKDLVPQQPPQIAREELSEKSEESEDNEDLSGDESKFKIGDDTMQPRLADNARFLISGRPFRLYKQNVRTFIQPVHPTADAQKSPHDSICQNGTTESDLPGLGYDIDFPRGFSAYVQDMCKKGIEHVAGCRLSWWPLTEPEDALEPHHIRVYSMPFVRSSILSSLSTEPSQSTNQVSARSAFL
jgi:tetratricopeptide (TPR) repeat protein